MSLLSHAAKPVAVVLGAAARPDGTPSPALVRRARAAAALHAGGAVDQLLLTGGSLVASAPSEAAQMAEVLRAAGVPAEALILEPAARTTRENARHSLSLLRAKGWRGVELVVVSDAWHLPRARLLFRIMAWRLGLRLRLSSHAVRPDRPSWRWRLGWLRESAALPLDAVRVWRA